MEESRKEDPSERPNNEEIDSNSMVTDRFVTGRHIPNTMNLVNGLIAIHFE